jgi:hypothetical protein
MPPLKECQEAGLDCSFCIRHTAGQLARVSQGLPPRTLTQLFVELYPDPACASMHARFGAAYRQASEETPRRGVAGEPFVRVRAAVA